VSRSHRCSPDARNHDVVVAFISGADTGLRVVGIAMLVLGALVTVPSLFRSRT
jgi:Na+/H+-translocating membrane pyrophosphatase